MELPQALAEVPLGVLIALSVVLLFCVLILARVISNTLLRGNAPPVFEGVPFIGGMLKFGKVGQWRAPSSPLKF